MAYKRDERLERLLKTVLEHFDKEDRSVRERQILLWRKLKLYWDGFTHVWYSETAHDWRIWDISQESESSTDQQYYDKNVNIFRAYLESIIAALSITIPPIKCVPDDADNALDISTARAGDKIAELIYKHNDVILLWLHGLFIYCTEGAVYNYNYTHKDEKYGTVDIEKKEDRENFYCPECESKLESSLEQECPECNSMITPEIKIETEIVGITKKPKSRQCLEAYGGLYVKTPTYAMKQSDMPYLIFSYETHYANAVEQYEHLRGKVSPQELQKIKVGGVHDPYEQWGRINPQYQGEFPINNVTVRNAWFRPSAFNVLGDEDDVQYLKDKFPKGAKCVFINDEYAEACKEELDNHWTVTRNPLSDYIQHDPLGLLLTSIQDITNDIVSLVLQTIEHGIGQAFADPQTLNFDEYRQTEVLPGGIYPAKRRSGQNLSEGFYELKTAHLSGEVLPFSQWINERGQLVSGALPSLFGGAQVEGSKTAAEYSMSRAQALQRLQTPWRMMTVWWKEIFGKVITSYIDNMMEDERYVQSDSSGNFINVFIRKAELQGKIGSIEVEAADNLPITWAQKKDVWMQLMQAGNPVIMQTLLAPENLQTWKEVLGLNDVAIPGEEDRTKQFEEIQLLINSDPIVVPVPMTDPMTGQPVINPMTGQPEIQEQEEPSVPIDPELDNHVIEAEICRFWLLSEAGRQAKSDNPAGYKNVLLHFKLHKELAAAQAAPQPEMGNPQNQGLAAPIKKEKENVES